MINLSHSVSGETVGRELARDAEELARALFEAAQHLTDRDLGELRDALSDVADFASVTERQRGRILAEAIAAVLATA